MNAEPAPDHPIRASPIFFSIGLSAQQFHKRLSPADEPSFALADPEQKLQVTDEWVYRGLPRRRLIFAGVHGDEWFVHYERGGLATGYFVLLFKVDPHNQLQFVWGGAGRHAARNLDQLRKMVVAGQFSDDQSYNW
jgi:hypothetical protein